MNSNKKQNRHSATLKKNVIGLTGILVVMLLTACSNKQRGSERVTQNVQTEQKATQVEQETKNIADDLSKQQDEISQLETTVIENSNQANISDSSNENAYFLSTKSAFYEKVAYNPIDQKYVIDEEAAPLEIWQSALKKCEAWNQQIDFTGSQLERLLSKADYEQLQSAISLWCEYYQEEVYQNRELYGNNGMILGSIYTAISTDILIEKCKLTSFILLSQEYELSSNVSFAENTTITNNDSEYSFSPQIFCIEYSPDFEETLISYSINEKNSDELEELIHETANKIEKKFGHDFTEHTNKYVSFIHALYTIENNISEDSNLCLILKENRLRLYAIELLNIIYMIDGQ